MRDVPGLGLPTSDCGKGRVTDGGRGRTAVTTEALQRTYNETSTHNGLEWAAFNTGHSGVRAN